MDSNRSFSQIWNGMTSAPDRYETRSFYPRQLFDDFDALEAGDAREFIPPEYLNSPTSWWQCRVTREHKVNFAMRVERKTSDDSQKGVSECFILSAKRVGDDFYISQYESFPNECNPGEVPQHRYCAVLRKETPNRCDNFRLYLTGWREEEKIGFIAHGWTQCPSSRANVRAFRAQIPEPTQREGSKYVWDLKAGQKSIHAYPQNANARDKCVSYIETIDSKISKDNRNELPLIRLANKMPEWDPKSKCFVMKFLHKRVRKSSKKNMLLYQSLVGECGKSDGQELPVLQFGKRDRSQTKSSFVLDFRHPLSPIQAFAIALSGFAFTKHV